MCVHGGPGLALPGKGAWFSVLDHSPRIYTRACVEGVLVPETAVYYTRNSGSEKMSLRATITPISIAIPRVSYVCSL